MGFLGKTCPLVKPFDFGLIRLQGPPGVSGGCESQSRSSQVTPVGPKMNPRETIPADPAAIELSEALSNSEQRYALLIERVGYGVYRSTPDGRFLEVNSVLAAMLGYSSANDVLALD